MRLELSDVALEARCEAARQRIIAGDDPFDALHAAIWPEAIPVFETTAEPVDGYCPRGHPWNAENTYVRPGNGRKCRACERLLKRPKKERPRKKEPCVHCGAPATSARDKGTGGLPIPRCRACFLESLKKR